MATPWKDRKSSSLLIALALKCIDLARVPLTAFGVDARKLRTIVALRLSLDLDPRWSLRSGEASLGLVLACCAAWLSGLGPGIAALVTHKPMFWLGIGQGLTLLLCLGLLFLQYGSMLVDSTDVRVIAPLPVSDRTLFAARFAHVLFYVSVLCACSAFFPAVLGAIVFPPWWALTIYPLATFLSGFTALALVGCLYALALRIAGPRRYQRLVLWVQIAGMSCLIAGGQVLPRLLTDRLKDSSPEQLAGLRWLLPPFHQLGLYELFAVGPTPERFTLAALALLVPVAGLAVALALASRHFVAALSAREVFASPGGDPWRVSWLSRLGRLIARPRVERAGYDFALVLARRERMFLRAIVPQTVMFAAMGFGSLRARPELGDMLSRTFACMPITLSALFGPIAVGSTMSEQYEARWVLRASPIIDWSGFGAAAVRALFTGMVLPAMLAIVAVVALASKGEHLVGLVVAFELALVISLNTVPHVHAPFPFCTPPRVEGGNMRGVPAVFTAVMASSVAALLAAATSLHWAAELGAALALVPLCIRGWRGLTRVRFTSLPS